ncbi:MAG: tetratricopeptide repeat protein, partial [Patescibacteria group bacterium]
AKVWRDRAIRLNSTDDAYYQGRAQVALAAVQRLIAQVAANPTQDISAAFRQEFSDGVTAAQRAATISPNDPGNWTALAQLYEAVMPFVSGADQAALGGYERAFAQDPTNSAIRFVQGRIYLAQADLLTLQINQTRSGDERSRLEAVRKDLWQKAGEALKVSVGLKADYAQAHFLLAQLAIRENNLAEAIKRTEATAVLAPLDIGVAFQMGLLYYRADRLDNAKREFERAILLNDNYSNARYFLGLIWDRKGDKDAALSQFQKIAALNSNNEEVARIIANLMARKSALDGIAPPAPAPETRKEAPVREQEEGERPLRRR